VGVAGSIPVSSTATYSSSEMIGKLIK